MTGDDATDQLIFVPLGGTGEIGMNLNLYGYGPPGSRRWLMIDLGIGFTGSDFPGTDIMMPDPTFIEDRRDRLDGIVLTHAHEDHLGAVPYLWPRLQCPVYGTRFTLAVLRRKLGECGLENIVPLVEVPPGSRFRVGSFALQLVTLTHSIPEANGVVIRTPAGAVFHTGDWKLDPDPVVGPVSDVQALKWLRTEPIVAMVCDSTNVFEAETSGSEGALLGPLTDLIGRCKKLVAVTCFSTNVARLETIARAAAAAGREVALVGASLKRIDVAARECGYLGDIRPFVDEADVGDLPRDKTLLICTGSQGEPRAALARIAEGGHPIGTLRAGDMVIFSSRVIPGNETAIGRVQNTLVRAGVEIITRREAFVHVSGHPARDELTQMYGWVRPRVSVPVHGELRHLKAHADLARACRVPEAIGAENGDVVYLAPGPARIDGSVPVGRLTKEGSRLVPEGSDLMRERNRAAHNGAAVITVVLNGRRLPKADPQMSTIGLLESDDDSARERIRRDVWNAIDGMTEKTYKDDDAVRETIRLAVRRAFRELIGKKPLTHVHLVRV
jgi:ribonuclease J